MKILNQRLSLFLLAILDLFLITSCKKDKLLNELEVFKGKYTWQYTMYREHWWSTTTLTRPASNSNYTAEIEFNNEGRIIFYINGQEIHKTGYSIENQETSNNGKTIWIKVDPIKENSKNLDLNDDVDFTITNDTLTVDNFPGTSYDEELFGTHYFTRNQ